MTSPLAIQLMRFAFLALLWLFIYGMVRVIRTELRTSGAPRVPVPRQAQARPSAARPPPRARPARGRAVPADRHRGRLAGTRIALTGKPILIGRANDSTLVLTDDYASTRHARISETNGVWYLEDLGSTNGTYVGQTKVDRPDPAGGRRRRSGSARPPWNCDDRMALTLKYAVRSDRGLVRSNNEDSVYAGPRLLAIADGMGGHAGRRGRVQDRHRHREELDEDRPIADLIGALRDRWPTPTRRWRTRSTRTRQLEGMGTTLTAIRFAGSRIALVHVGDSRAYLLRGGQLTQITHDDTYVQSLVDSGKLTAEEASPPPAPVDDPARAERHRGRPGHLDPRGPQGRPVPALQRRPDRRRHRQHPARGAVRRAPRRTAPTG